MKKRNIFIVLVILSLTSCKKFLDVNENPNDVTVAPSKVLLPSATIGVAWANGNLAGLSTSLWMQYNAGFGAKTRDYDQYRIAGADFNLDWNNSIYRGSVVDLKTIISQSEGTNNAYSGIAKIQLAYVISVATDLWGDVPYSQAGMGEVFTQPRYDKQSDIYQGNGALGITSLFDLVKSGIADLDKPSVLKPANDDLIYGGDLTKWKRAGNSLILKLANTISGVNPALAKANIQSVLSSPAGFINDNQYNMAVPFSTTTNNQNPIYTVDRMGIYKNTQMLSTRLLNLSKSIRDTVRLSKFYTKPNNKFTTYQNGAATTIPAAATRSVYTSYVIGASGEAPVRLLTAFQSDFILAESAVTLGINVNADSLYKAGIKASMTMVGMTTAEIDGYFNSAANASVITLTGTAVQKQQQIITQKYLAWVGNGIEAYNDYRRTGYPVLTPALNAGGDNNGQIPLRILYTTLEGNVNANQPNPIPKTSEKVWWDN